MSEGRSFTVRGGRNGSQLFVTWTDGVLSGDPPTIDLLEVEAEFAGLHPHDAHSWGRVSDLASLPENPLSDPDAAYALMVSVFDTISVGEGELPAAAMRDLKSAGSA